MSFPAWCSLPFQADRRSLLAFRIGIGLCLLGDLWTRIGSAAMFYTDEGALPRAALQHSQANAPHLTLYFLSGSLSWVYTLFAVAALLALAFMAGIFTRLVTLLSWLLLASLHVRNSTVLQGGDSILLLALFWSLFLPLERAPSIDALANPPAKPGEPELSVGTIAMTLQLFAIYFVSGVLKARMGYWQRGEGVYNALSADHFVTVFGEWLYQFEGALTWMSHGTLVLELAVPFLLFVPWKFGPLRTALVLLFVGFHAGLGASLDLGLFPWVSAAAWSIALPGWFWDRLAESALGQRLADTFSKFGALVSPVVTALLRGRVAISDRLRPLSRRATRWHWPNVVQLLGAAALAYSAMLAVGELYPRFDPKGPLAAPQSLLRLSQGWRMFVPPYKDAGWFVAAGTQADGSTINVLFGKGGEVDWERPEYVARTFPDQRWRKYLVNLRKPQFSGHRKRLGVALCREWNDAHPEQPIQSVEVVYLKRTIELHYQRGPVQRDSWLRQSCRG